MEICLFVTRERQICEIPHTVLSCLNKNALTSSCSYVLHNSVHAECKFLKGVSFFFLSVCLSFFLLKSDSLLFFLFFILLKDESLHFSFFLTFSPFFSSSFSLSFFLKGFCN